MNKLAKVQNNGSLVNNDRRTDFSTWSSWIDNLFNNDLPVLTMSNFNTGMTLPKVNIWETADSFYVDMAIPGMIKEDFSIDLDNQILSISSEKSVEHEENQKHYTRREFGYESFKRTFNLPESVEETKIEASYKNGILNIQLPKKEEAKRKPPRTISIS